MAVERVTVADLLLHHPGAAQPRHIGWLSKAGDVRRVDFTTDYIEDPRRPTLSLVYKGADERATRRMLTEDHAHVLRTGVLPAYFSNLLPEGENRIALADKRGVSVTDEFELLTAAGHDLFGALEVVPARDVPPDVLAAHWRGAGRTVELEAAEPPVEDGFSLGGYVTKFSMVQQGRRYVVRSGTEAGQFINKLPTVAYPDLIANEAACYRLAEAVGIHHAGASARPIEELALDIDWPASFTHYLNVPRFDRVRTADGGTRRVHCEELVQVLGLSPAQKYRNIDGAMAALLSLLASSDASSPRDIDEVIRRWTLFALMGGTDAHLKNWALIYPDGVNPALAPAYDLVSVSSYFDEQQPRRLAQNRAMDASLRSWGPARAAQLGEAAGLRTTARLRRVVRETADQALRAWPALLEEAPDRMRAHVGQRLCELAQPMLAGGGSVTVTAPGTSEA